MLNKEAKTASAKSLAFRHEKVELSGKTLNIFECSEAISDIIISERSFVILTFNSNDTEEKIKISILTRFLKILTKVMPI